jgi:fumarate reductase subunit C
MWDLFLHLWAAPPTQLSLTCPAGAPGQTTNPTGNFDERTVQAAYSIVATESFVVVLLLVVACYGVTRMSSGPRFTRRWLGFWCASVVLVAAVVGLQLHLAPGTTAEVNSCESNPAAFPVPLPMATVMLRTLAGGAWAAFAFPLLSVVLTQTFGRWATLGNGFFHNRGTPWPRLLSSPK